MIARSKPTVLRVVILTLAICLFPRLSLAAEELDSGDTAWVIVSSALVLMMTLPGLFLFYGGLVRSVNVISMSIQCYAIACLASVLWFTVGYSLAFGDGGQVNAWIGGLEKAFLAGVDADALVGKIPESVFFTFQMTFVVITLSLITGACAERIKFAHVMLFSGLWGILVYAPVTHWIWGGGFLATLGVLDFAGGLTVHTTAGVSAIVIGSMLGRRLRSPHNLTPPHNPVLTVIGASLLWVGWSGFNAGSALAANGNAGLALVATHLSAAAASLVWMTLEWCHSGKPGLITTATGTIAGLATVTPAAGYVGPVGGLVCGILGGVLCYYAVPVVRSRLGVDDALDVFAVHGIGGILGTLLVAVLGAEMFGGLGLENRIASQIFYQAAGAVVVIVWSVAATWLIVHLTRAMVGFRVSEKEETEGLDFESHGERGYTL